LRHCDAIALNLRDCQTVSGDTDKDELTSILKEHERGNFKYLINCQLLTVGYDMPWVDMIALLFATKSKRKYEQCVYRGTRTYAGKSDFLVLDMGNNFYEHGALGSPYQGKVKGEPEQKKGRICPNCESWMAQASAESCTDCGYVFEKREPPKVKHDYEPVGAEALPVYTGSIQFHPVHNVTYKEKKSAKGNPMIVVEYHCDHGKYGTIADFLIPHHESDFVTGRVKKWFKDRGDDIYGSLSEYSLLDLLWRAENNCKKPSGITVDHSEKFPRIKSYEWGETVKQLSISEVLDEDSIPF
jgi:ribosomal protein S27AE